MNDLGAVVGVAVGGPLGAVVGAKAAVMTGTAVGAVRTFNREKNSLYNYSKRKHFCVAQFR